MKLNLFISSSRFAKQRDIVFSSVQEFCSINNHEAPYFHDCNKNDTALLDSPQQLEYDRLIRQETDIFIALLPASTIGMHTFHEVEVAYETYLKSVGFPLCFIFVASNPLEIEKGETDRGVDELHARIKGLSAAKGSVENPEDISHFFIDYSSGDDLRLKVIQQLSLAIQRGRFFLRRYARLGEAIKPEELMGERAKMEKGFLSNYFPRSYDNELSKEFNSVVLIKGKSGAGKTRALYELISNGRLRYENVIIIDRDNSSLFNTVYDIVFQKDQYQRVQASQADKQNRYNIILDEVDRMFSGEDLHRLKKLMDFAATDDRFSLYMTTTNDGYKSIEASYNDFFDPSKCKNITIKPLNASDRDDQQVLKRCREFFGAANNEVYDTIGGFNKGLRQGISRMLEEVIERDDDELVFKSSTKANHLLSFCLSHMVIRKFRRNSAEYLSMTIQLCNEVYELRAEECIMLLNYLISNGIIQVFEVTTAHDRKTVQSFQRGNFRFSKREYTIKGEDVTLIIDPKYIFYFDDLIWDTLLKTRDLNDYAEVDQIDDFIKCFGDGTRTYSKVITRSDNKEKTWTTMYKLFTNGDIQASVCNDSLFLNILIEYAPTFDKAIEVFESFVANDALDYTVDGNSLAALISHINRSESERSKILAYIEGLNAQHTIAPTIYYHYRCMSLTTNNTFDEAYEYLLDIKEFVDNLYNTEEKDSIVYQNAISCYVILLKCVRNLRDLKRVYQLILDKPDIKISLFVFNKVIISKKGDKEKLAMIYDFFFGKQDTNEPATTILSRFKEEQQDFAKQYIIGCLVKNSDTFEDALHYVESAPRGLVESKVLSQLFGRIANNDKNFSAAIEFLQKLNSEGRHFNVVVYNTLIKNAPNYLCAESALQLMEQRDIYTLNNTLKVLVDDYRAEVERIKIESISKEKYTNILDREIGIQLVNQKIVTEKSHFKGVAIDEFSIITILSVDDPNMTHWIETLLEKNSAVKSMIEGYYLYYGTLIKNAKSVAEIKHIFTIYLEKGFDKKISYNKPDVFNTISYKLRIIPTADGEEVYRMWFKELLNEYKELVEFDQHTIVNYFSLYPAEVLNETEDDLSEKFYTLLETYHIEEIGYPFFAASCYFFTNICNWDIEKDFKNRKMIYDKYVAYCNSRYLPLETSELKRIIGSLFYAVKTIEQRDICMKEYEKYHLPKDSKYTRSVKRTNIELGIDDGNELTLSDKCYNKIQLANDAIQLVEDIEQFMVEHSTLKIDARLSSALFTRIRNLTNTDADSRRKITTRVEQFIDHYLDRIDIQLYGYNGLLGFYYPEVKKRAKYNELKSKGIKPDGLTHVTFISDWASSIATVRDFFENSREILDDVKTNNSYLLQEVVAYLRGKESTITYIYNQICTIHSKDMYIQNRVFNKVSKDSVNHPRKKIREEYQYATNAQEFLFSHIYSKLKDEESKTKWKEIATTYKVYFP